MKNVIELDQDEIINAIGFYFKAHGAPGDVGTIKFAFDGKGEVLATLEGDGAEPGELDDEDDGIEDDGIGHETVAPAITQQDTEDCFSKEPISDGFRCLWIEGVGITRVHPVEWPADIKEEHPLTGEQLTSVSRWINKQVPDVGITPTTVPALAVLLQGVTKHLPWWVATLGRLQEDVEDIVTGEVLKEGDFAVMIEGEGPTVASVDEVRARFGASKASVPKISAAELLDQIQERFGDREMAVAICQRDSVDFVSGEPLLANAQAVWFDGHGVTITPLEDWPEEVIALFEEKTGTEASTAADILGGGGDDPVDRSSALEKGLGRKG